jgi:hypothetical protein
VKAPESNCKLDGNQCGGFTSLIQYSMYVLTSLSRTMSLPCGICECLLMRSHSQKVGIVMLLEWIIKAQNDVTVKTVIRSFKKYDVLNSMDGTQGNLLWQDGEEAEVKAPSNDSVSSISWFTCKGILNEHIMSDFDDENTYKS